MNDFWKEVNKIINKHLERDIQLGKYNIILGIEQSSNELKFSNKERKFINKIIIIGKLAIIKSKNQNINLAIIFKNELQSRKIEIKNYDWTL